MNPLLRRVLMILLPFVGIGFFVAAALVGGSNENAVLPEGVEALFPNENAKTLAQDRVGADLQFGWAANLTINGTPIPADQLDQDSGLNQVAFTPGKGKALEELQPNKNCVVVEFWRVLDGPSASNPTRSWCFNVV